MSELAKLRASRKGSIAPKAGAALRCSVLAFALCSSAARVSAHAPLPRGVAVSPSGAAVALELPGFGLLLRSGADSSFAYACDALLGVPQSDLPAALQYFDDQRLLVGSPGGLRVVAADGCPLEARHPILGMAAVMAIAIHPTTQIAYVIAAGAGDGVWRSTDRGVTWERRGSIEMSGQVTGAAVDPEDATKLFVTRSGPGAGSTLLVSSDAASSFASFPQERAITVLAVRPPPLGSWAVARALDAVGNRGFEILHASDLQAPWTKALRVNYFGGLTIDPEGAIWVGDEGGGVYRSTDGGTTFSEVDAKSRVACLASAKDSVWACTPDLPTAPNLKQWDGESAFQPAVAFDDVDQLVACGADVDVAGRCQLAWVEWQRDVLMRNLTTQDAGTPETRDAGVLQPTAAGSDAGMPPARPSTLAANSSKPSGGCASAGPLSGAPGSCVAGFLMVATLAARTRCRRRARG